jgi:hypothetical protein
VISCGFQSASIGVSCVLTGTRAGIVLPGQWSAVRIPSGAPAHRGTFFVIAAAVKNSPG